MKVLGALFVFGSLTLMLIVLVVSAGDPEPGTPLPRAGEWVEAASGHIGCGTVQEWERLMELVRQGDAEASAGYMRRSSCRAVPAGRAFLERVDGWRRSVCVRPEGQANCLWTAPEAVR